MPFQPLNEEKMEHLRQQAAICIRDKGRKNRRPANKTPLNQVHPIFPPAISTLPQRQMHLDFHTSPWISDGGSEFNAEVFIQIFADAHVNSVTIFCQMPPWHELLPDQSGKKPPRAPDYNPDHFNPLQQETVCEQ